MKKTTLRRGTAVALAGLTVLPAYSMVASAASYSTNIYEFTYGTVSVVKSTAKADRLLSNNSYVTAYDFDGKFTIENLSLFALDDAVVESWCADGATSWTYKDQWTGEDILVADYVEDRGGSLGLAFVFKTKAERDAAISAIKAGVKSDYTSKANAAYSQLNKDLTQANNALYKKDIDAATETYNSAIANANEIYENSAKDADAKAELAEAKKQASAAKTAANKDASEAKSERAKQQKEALAEFKEVYAIGNFDFDHNDDLFVIDDTKTIVSYNTYGNKISEGTYDGTSGGTLGDLLTCYYHTTGERVDSKNYAFKGEIIPAADRKKDLYDEYVMSDKWVLFSVFVEGGITDNDYTTETGDSTSDDDDDTTTTTPDQTAVYKVGNSYYPTYSAAYVAAAGNEDIISLVRDYTTLPNDYFSQVTGSFYSTYEAALKASGDNSAKVTVFNGASTSTNDSNLDPYYLYWLNKQNGTTTTKDTTSATLGKNKGWSAITNYLNKSGAGTSATVDMNKETTVPSSVLSAIEGKNVTVKFVQDNGASLTVNGKDIADAKNVEIDVTYNTKNISKKLIQNAFKKNGAVSSAQISIDEGSFGFESDLTVKFNSKRAGYSAKIYRYNSSRNSLQLVDTATVSNSGKTTFNNITKGGEFVIVLFED